MSYYDDYFDIQYGGGRHSGIDRVYIGTQHQRGHGIGSFLGGLFRRVLPLLSKGAKVVGREFVRSGVHIADDVISRDIPFKDAFNTRLRDSAIHLKRKAEEKLDNLMNGSGYKRAKISKLKHSVKDRERQYIVKGVKKKSVLKRAIRKSKTNTVKKKKRGLKKKKNLSRNRSVVDIFQ